MTILETIRLATTLTTLLFFISFLINIIQSFRIRFLGSRTSVIHGWLPFNADVALRAIWDSSRQRDLRFWAWLFSRCPPGSPTSESTICGQRVIFTAQPENIEAILASTFSHYGKGKQFHNDWKEFLGDSIFTTDGDSWVKSRQLIRPLFAQSRLLDLQHFEVHIQRLLDRTNEKQIDISINFYQYTLNVAMDVLVGYSFDSLHKYGDEFAQALNDVRRTQNEIVRSGPFSSFIGRKRFRTGLKVIEDFLSPLITRCLTSNPKDLKKDSFLQNLAALTIDPKIIRDQLVAILLAGRDTTASTLSFLFLELSTHHEAVSKLREEIVKITGIDRPPTSTDLSKMRYLKNCIMETLRLYPAVPFNIRYALRDTTLPTGGEPNGNQPIGVLKHTPIAYSTLYMQRRADLYPPPSGTFTQYDSFDPDRWDIWQPDKWSCNPFNGGPRVCIGQKFAFNEIAYTLVRILQHLNPRRISNNDFLLYETDRFNSEVVLGLYESIYLFFERY